MCFHQQNEEISFVTFASFIQFLFYPTPYFWIWIIRFEKTQWSQLLLCDFDDIDDIDDSDDFDAFDDSDDIDDIDDFDD